MDHEKGKLGFVQNAPALAARALRRPGCAGPAPAWPGKV